VFIKNILPSRGNEKGKFAVVRGRELIFMEISLGQGEKGGLKDGGNFG